MSRFARIFDRFASVWLTVFLAFIAVYIHFGGLAFAGLAILLGAAGWLVWLLNQSDYPIITRDTAVAAAAFGAFFIWLAISGSWSQAGPETAIRLAGQLVLSAAIPILFLTRSMWRQSAVSQLIMAMTLAGVAILALDVASGYGINLFLDPVSPDGNLEKRVADAEMNIGRGHVVYAVLTPLLLALFATRMPKGRAGPASLVFVALLVIGTLMNKLAIVPIILICAAPFLYLGYCAPKTGLRVSLGIFAGSILFAPLIGVLSRLMGEGVMARLPMSWDHRVRMWDYSLTKIQDAPLIGTGLDGSRTMQDAFTTRIGVDWPIVSLHPHNIGLQTWLEAGLIGAVLLTLALLSLYRPLRRLCGNSPWRGAAISGVLMSVAVGSAVTVGAWQYWWWGLVAVGLSLVILIPVPQQLSSSEIVK